MDAATTPAGAAVAKGAKGAKGGSGGADGSSSGSEEEEEDGGGGGDAAVEAAECLRLALSLCLEVLASLGAAVEGAGADVREPAEAA